jgi:acyl-CoA-binding protein
MSVEDRFKRAVYMIRNGPPKEGTSDAEKLKVYSLYKQATEGIQI